MRNGFCLLAIVAMLAGSGCGRETPGEQSEGKSKPSLTVAPVKKEAAQPQASNLPPPLELPPSLEHVLLPPAPSILNATRPGENALPPPLILPVTVTQPTSASDLPLPPPLPK